jgi:hypothetical protein
MYTIPHALLYCLSLHVVFDYCLASLMMAFRELC